MCVERRQAQPGRRLIGTGAPLRISRLGSEAPWAIMSAFPAGARDATRGAPLDEHDERALTGALPVGREGDASHHSPSKAPLTSGAPRRLAASPRPPPVVGVLGAQTSTDT